MALTLNDIYSPTKTVYNLSLLCGENGLSNIVNWVYISEDINNADFLRGGELVITTGLSYHDSSWLYNFIEKLIKHHTCGIIVNVGKYIHVESITTDILNLCNKYNYPLFVMPWEIHIYDITHDYYNRLFQDDRIDSTITDAFLSLIRLDDNINHSIKLLEDYSYLENESYCIFLLSFLSTDMDTKDLLQHLLFSVKSYLKLNQLKYHVAIYKNNILFVCHNETVQNIKQIITPFLDYLRKCYLQLEFRVGVGNSTYHLKELALSYRQALAALTMSNHHKLPTYTFEEMGFFKLLLSVSDVNVLKDYAYSYLGKLIEYDNIHNSNYLETLRQYLLHNGSIQMIAHSMFCHRNTINYRIHVIKENLGYDLENTQIRFNLMASYYIIDYLKILS